MVKEIQTKKRKASVPESGAEKIKKVKKVDAQAVPAKKRKATDDVAVPEVKKTKVVSSTSKPKVEQPAKANPAKKAITSDKTEKKANGDAKPSKATNKSTPSSKKPVSEPKTKEPEPVQSDDADDVSEVEVEDEDEGEASEIDDQTEALLKGFESDGDDDAENQEGLPDGQEVPKLTKSQKKKLKKGTQEGTSDKPGVVYIGRVPHGFYEHEMREYFKQFGTILKLRLSRNRKTGASKHFAFVQFESATVADIVAKTMDNYLLFGHILKVKVIPDEQVPADIFKGANKRFKKVPWNQMEGRKLKQGATEEVWGNRIEAEEKKRAEKADKLKKIGYEFDPPQLKSAKGVSKLAEVPTLTEKEDTEVKAIEAAPISGDSTITVGSKKAKKVKKSEAAKAVEAPADVPVSEVVEKVVKVKKAEAGDVVEASEVKVKKSKASESVEVSEVSVKKHKKKSKKAKAV
ncbi:putative RNA-binding protein [Lachnellula willkommii]|uniref:Putative RNA-binding protein n=1 Tax=Lachnellula willkommii TaxID=215461 RepID=A0A559M3P6_9HELO|nr:putative RNA-binding protein [Lachnellula willkommii]